MGTEHTIERTALLKILLHAIKYPAYSVNGVLLGTLAGGVVTARDAVPLVHTFTTLVPAFETALCQVDLYCKSQTGLQVVGYYQANENIKDTQLSGTGKQLASKVASLYPGAIAVVVDNKGLKELLSSAPDSTSFLRLFTHEGRGWSEVAPAGRLALHTAGLEAVLQQYSAEGRHRRLADFEDHLDDVCLDWLNAELVTAA